MTLEQQQLIVCVTLEPGIKLLYSNIDKTQLLL